MKKTLLALALATSFLSGVSLAKDINIVRMAPPGGASSLWVDAMSETLRNNGYDVSIIGTGTCKEALQWITDNPGKPSIMFNFSYQIAIGMHDPNNLAGCPAPITVDSLVGIMGKWYHFLCGNEGKNSVQSLVESRGAKIASMNDPIQNKILEDQLTDIGARDFRIIKYASGKDMIQAYVSGDTDYIVYSTESRAEDFPGSCFITTAPKEVAVTMKNGDTIGRATYTDINPNARHAGMGLWPVVVSYNTDIDEIRRMLQASDKNSLLGKILRTYQPVTSSIEQQIEELRKTSQILKD